MLSCACDIDEDGWWYHPPSDYKTADWKRRKRCCSCGKLIDTGTPCLSFERFRGPYNDIEYRIWGDEVQLADWHMCEWCGEMYLNLESIGYCHMLGGNIKEDLADYWDLTGFRPQREVMPT